MLLETHLKQQISATNLIFTLYQDILKETTDILNKSLNENELPKVITQYNNLDLIPTEKCLAITVIKTLEGTCMYYLCNLLISH